VGDIAISVGTRFRASYADGVPLWEVLGSVGPDAWQAVVVDEMVEIDGRLVGADYVGAIRLFDTSEIRACLEGAREWQAFEVENARWWSQRKAGEVLHYHNGFGRYVRGEVVDLADGERGLLPRALVGRWRDYELPRRREDGAVDLPYHVEGIDNEKAWQPNISMIFEAMSWRPEPDPRGMEPIDLTLPALTPEEERRAELERLRREVLEALQEPDVDAALRSARHLLGPGRR
jgi:hypothetical protein